jgi:hypothetical protein
MYNRWRWTGTVAAVALLTATLAARPQPPGDSPKQQLAKSAAEQYQALVKEVDDAMQNFMKEYNAAKTDEEKSKLVQEKYPQPPKYAARFLKIAEDSPKDPAALDALVWICSRVGSGPEITKALDILIRDHLQSDKLTGAVAALGRMPDGEKQLRTILEKNPHHAVQGMACFYLAQNLKGRGLRGTETLRQEAETLFERVIKDFADVKYGTRSLSAMAEGELFESRNLVIGKVAPDIEGEDIDGVKFKLSDYRGKVVMLDFWGHW